MSDLETARAAREALVGLPDRAAKLLRDYRDTRVAAAERWDIAPSTRQQLAGIVKADYDRALAELEQEHQKAEAQFTEAVSRARSRPGAMGTDEAMGWQRFEAKLAAGRHTRADAPLTMIAHKAVDEFRAAGDQAALRAARAMLPSRLEAEGELFDDKLRDTLDELAGSDDVRAAVALQREGSRGLANVKTSMSGAAGEIRSQTGFAAGAVARWDGTVDVLGDAPPYDQIAHVATAESVRGLAAAGFRAADEGHTLKKV